MIRKQYTDNMKIKDAILDCVQCLYICTCNSHWNEKYEQLRYNTGTIQRDGDQTWTSFRVLSMSHFIHFRQDGGSNLDTMIDLIQSLLHVTIDVR